MLIFQPWLIGQVMGVHGYELTMMCKLVRGLMETLSVDTRRFIPGSSPIAHHIIGNFVISISFLLKDYQICLSSKELSTT